MPRGPLQRIGTSVLNDRNALSEVIEAIGFGRGQVYQVTICGLVSFVSGVAMILVSSIPNDVAKSLEMAKVTQAYPAMSNFFGAGIGNIVSGPMGDANGRRLPILLSLLGVAVLQCACAGAFNLWTILLCMFLLGLTMGLGQPPMAVLGCEIVPAESRIYAGFIGSVLFTAGAVYAGLLIFFDDPMMKDLSWRWLLLIGAIPAMIALPTAYFILYESPFYLAMRHENDAAREVLDGLRTMNGNPDVPTEFTPPRRKLTSSKTRTLKTDSNETWDNLRIIFGANMIFTTFVVCFVKLVCNLSYYGGMYAFPQVLPTLDTTISPALSSIFGALAEIPGCLIGILAGMYLSRKVSIILALLATGLTMVLFALAAAYLGGEKASGNMEYLLHASLWSFRGVTSITFMILPLYICEVFPTRARTLGYAVGVSVGRIGGFSAPMLYELLTSSFGKLAIFYVIAGLNVIGSVLVFMLPIETKGKALADNAEGESEPLLDK